MVAVVSDPLWEEDGGLLWHDRELVSWRLRLVLGIVRQHKPFCVCLQWAIPFMILIVSIKSNLIVSYLVSVAAGASVAAAFLLPW